MNGIVIYKGKYGSTKQYADWLGTDLDMPVFISEAIYKDQLLNYEFIVLGTSVYAGKFLITPWLKKNISVLINFRLYLFVVCGTSMDKKEKLRHYVESNMPPEIRNSCSIYFLPGRLKIENLSWFDKLILKVGALFAKNTEAVDEIRIQYDDVKKENLNELMLDLTRMNARPNNIYQYQGADKF